VQQPTILQTVTDENGVFEVRVTAFQEDRSFGRAFAGADYHFEVRTPGAGWRKIMEFHHDDQVAVGKNQVRFVNERVAYVFIGWLYAVTTDAGQTWHIWDANNSGILGTERIGYDGIQSIKLDTEGRGRMLLNVIGRQDRIELTTEDFGITWGLTIEQEQ